MNLQELTTVANTSSDFGEIYNSLRGRIDNPLEIAVYVWTKVKSCSEYSIPTQLVFETSVSEFQRRTNSQEVHENAMRRR